MTKIKIDGKEIELPKSFIDAIKKQIKEEAQPIKKDKISTPLTGKRNCHYFFDTENNTKWKGQKDVWLEEDVAISFHNTFMQRGAKYLGDQNGNMALPRDLRAMQKIGNKPLEVCKKKI